MTAEVAVDPEQDRHDGQRDTPGQLSMQRFRRATVANLNKVREMGRRGRAFGQRGDCVTTSDSTVAAYFRVPFTDSTIISVALVGSQTLTLPVS